MNIRGIVLSALLALCLVPAVAMAYDYDGWDSDAFWEEDYGNWDADASWEEGYGDEESDDVWYDYAEDWWGGVSWWLDDVWETDYDAWWSDDDEWYDGEYSDEEWDADSLNAYDGAYWYGDRLETWYSSEDAYHELTDEWWVDEEGFYRTDEGYYVVAASDYEYGSVIEGSKGLCMVLDDGCDDGVSDYYVAW